MFYDITGVSICFLYQNTLYYLDATQCAALAPHNVLSWHHNVLCWQHIMYAPLYTVYSLGIQRAVLAAKLFCPGAEQCAVLTPCGVLPWYYTPWQHNVVTCIRLFGNIHCTVLATHNVLSWQHTQCAALSVECRHLLMWKDSSLSVKSKLYDGTTAPQTLNQNFMLVQQLSRHLHLIKII